MTGKLIVFPIYLIVVFYECFAFDLGIACNEKNFKLAVSYDEIDGKHYVYNKPYKWSAQRLLVRELPVLHLVEEGIFRPYKTVQHQRHLISFFVDQSRSDFDRNGHYIDSNNIRTLFDTDADFVFMRAAASYGNETIYVYETTQDTRHRYYNEHGEVMKKVDKELSPSTISVYDKQDGKFHMQVIFKEFLWTTYIQSPSEPVVMDRSHDYKYAGLWMGCEPQLCLDGQLDATAFTEGNKLIMVRGSHMWKIADTKLGSTSRLEESVVLRDVFKNGRYDGATEMRLGGQHKLLMFRKEQIVERNYNTEVEGQLSLTIFEGMSGHIDAAYGTNDTIVLIKDRKVYEYILNSEGKLIRSKSAKNGHYVRTQWRGVPSDIDDAASDSRKVTFFSGSFYYQGEINGGPVSPQMIAGHFFRCEDAFYKLHLSSIKINSYFDYVVYKAQFTPQPDTESSQTTPYDGATKFTRVPTTEVEDSETITRNSGPTKVEGARGEDQSKGSLPITIIIIGALLLLAILTGIGYVMTKKKRAVKNGVLDDMTEMTQYPTVQTTDSVAKSGNLKRKR
ncbi:hypothetical protein HDE_09357 [Halotydeus destructor]|nr:hypothetical protein HDE_09357 [Halotydeus destructor]